MDLLPFVAGMVMLFSASSVQAASAQMPSGAQAVATRASKPQLQGISIGSVQVRDIEPGLRLPIDLPTALAFAGARNLDVLEAKARTAEAVAIQEEVIGKLVPTAYGSGLFFGQNTSGQTQGYFTDLGRSFGRTNAAGGAELSLNPAQAIFAALAAHRSASATSSESFEVTQETLAAAASAYFVLLEARAEVQIAEQALAASRELQRVAETRESLGSGLKVDVSRAAAQAATDQIHLAQAGERMRNASVRLALLLKLDPKITLVPVDSVIRQKQLVEPARNLDDLLRQALLSRPNLHAERDRVVAAENSRIAAWASAIAPSIYTNFQANTVGNIGSHQFSVGSIGVRLSFASFGAAKAAGAQLAEEQIRRDRLKQQVEAEVITSRDRLQTAAEEVGAAIEGLKAAQRALDLSQTRFQGGKGIELEVLDANTTLTEAHYNVVAAIVGYNIAQVRLLQAIGAVSPETLIK
ncbi:MAG: TolC family protein [Candidatus Binataceae bacterium]